METTKVHMIYTGIIAIVPAAPPSGAMHMCIPNTSKTAHPHTPHVIVEDGSHSASGLKKVEEHPRLRVTAYLIEHNPITITSEVSPRPLRTRFDCFLDLQRGCSIVQPGCEQFNMGLLHSHDPAKIVSSIVLSEGELEACYVNPVFMWKFVDPDQGDVAWIAQELVHTFEIKGPKFNLSFGTSAQLTVQAPNYATTIEVRIGHTLPEDIFPSLRPAGEPPPEDKHVRMYHELSAVPTPVGQRRKMCPVEVDKADQLSSPPQSQDEHQYRLGGERIAIGSRRARLIGLGPRSIGGANCPPGLFRS